tara:strand:+ start:100 stop:1200 length:1101 start_codon:yes stop_codon:yes gene_type:complete
VYNLVSIVNGFLLLITIFSFHSITLSQAYPVKGQFIASGLTSNDIPDSWSSYETIIGYIPTLSLKKEMSNDQLVDAEWAYHLKRYYTGDSLFNFIANNHRLWIRYSSDKIEARLGIQKIVFGPTQILRPLSWFDTFDLKDPSGQTNGVESFRLRWFPSNNIAIWSWLINNDVDTLSFGGRAEISSEIGEFGFTYHQDPSKTMQLVGQTNIPVFNSQNRIALDYRFDGFVGFWNESVLIKSYRSNIKMVSIGVDYTLPILNGILVMTESMYIQSKYNNIQSNQNFSVFMASIPIGMIHQLMYISQMDWKEDKTYQYLRWSSTYDAYSLNMIISMNPKRNQYDIPVSLLPKSLSGFGTGIQFMFIYNH